MATRFDRLNDKLPPFQFNPSETNITALVAEVTNQFQYGGAVDPPIYPAGYGYTMFRDGQSHNHVAGRSDCNSFVLNLRMANPVSSWFGDLSIISTTIHEMVHVQQGLLCRTENRENLENTAQVVTLEVMAGLLNAGNELMAFPLM